MNYFPGVKRPGNKGEHLPPSCAKVMKEWSYSSTPPVFLHRNTTLPLEGIILISPLPIDPILCEDWIQKHIGQLAHSMHHILLTNYLLRRGERIRNLIYFLGISDYEGRLMQNATSGSFTLFCSNCPYHLEERSELPFCTYVLQQTQGSRHHA